MYSAAFGRLTDLKSSFKQVKIIESPSDGTDGAKESLFSKEGMLTSGSKLLTL